MFPTQVPDNLILSVEDIRHIRPCQLAQLTGIPSSNFSAWSGTRSISERSLERISQQLGISKADLLKGFDLRRQDQAIARHAQAKADQLIELLSLKQEPA